MDGKTARGKAALAREDQVLEKLATEFPRCRSSAHESPPKRCDAATCCSANECDFAIRESLQVCKGTAEQHFRNEGKVIGWLGDEGHQARHTSAHRLLIDRMAAISSAYMPLGDRLATIRAIERWGADLFEHTRSLDAEMRALWARRDAQVQDPPGRSGSDP